MSCGRPYGCFCTISQAEEVEEKEKQQGKQQQEVPWL